MKPSPIPLLFLLFIYFVSCTEKKPKQNVVAIMLDVSNRARIEDSIRKDSIPVFSITDTQQVELGKELFQQNCIVCHSLSANKSIGSDLRDTDWTYGGSSKEIYKSIFDGIPNKGMIAWKNQFTKEQVAQLVVYIQSIKK